VTDEFRKVYLRRVLRRGTQPMVVLMNLPAKQDRVKPDTTLREDIQRISGTGEACGKVITFFGYFYPDRPIKELIDAVALLGPTYRLALLGTIEDEYRSTLEQHAQAQGVAKRTHFLPPVPWRELIDYLHTADAALVFYGRDTPNNRLCSPNKLFEAMLAGLPVVATRQPLIRKVLASCFAGCTVPGTSPEEIAAGVQQLEHEGFSPQRRSAIQSLAEQTYTWESQQHRLTDLYQSVFEEGGPCMP